MVRILFATLLFIKIYGVRKIYQHYRYKKYGMPKGPLGLPVLGVGFQFMLNLKKFLNETAPAYGPLTAFKVFNINFMLINDWKLTKCLLQDPRLLNRPKVIFDNIFEIALNMVTTNDDEWMRQRKLIGASLPLIINKAYIETLLKQLLNESTFLSIDKCAEANTLWHPRDDCRCLTFSVIFIAIFGIIINDNNKSFDKFNKLTSEWIKRIFIQTIIKSAIPKKKIQEILHIKTKKKIL